MTPDISRRISYIEGMKRFLPPLFALILAAPLMADEPPPGEVDQGMGLIEQGTQLLLRGLISEMGPALQEMQKGLEGAMAEMEPALRHLAAMLGDIRNYEAPVKLPNGDILIRRKPDSPRPDMEIIPGPRGEIEL
ncbi:hypothetical protein [Phaeovulum sp.]|uniref:hypothetical protein n=1 Tax=Phaeovulum sp. TaxID=2934796 RepID=UPI0039E6066C